MNKTMVKIISAVTGSALAITVAACAFIPVYNACFANTDERAVHAGEPMTDETLMVGPKVIRTLEPIPKNADVKKPEPIQQEESQAAVATSGRTPGNASLDKNYFYNGLNSDQKQLYKTMEAHLENHDDALYTYGVDAGTYAYTSEDAADIFYGLMDSRPDIFWAYIVVNVYHDSGCISQIIPEYKYSASEAASIKNQIDNEIAGIVSNARNTDQYTGAYMIAEWLNNHCHYTTANIFETQNMASAILYGGHTCCMGYASAYAYICNKAGIDAVVISGIGDGTGHAWNVVCADGNYIWCDITWSDQSDTWNDSWYDADPGDFAERHQPFYGSAPRP